MYRQRNISNILKLKAAFNGSVDSMKSQATNDTVVMYVLWSVVLYRKTRYYIKVTSSAVKQFPTLGKQRSGKVHKYVKKKKK